MVFYDKKKLPPPPPDIPVTIDEKPLTKVKQRRVLRVIIDENLRFTSHIEQITKKMQNSLQQVNSTSRPITTSSITTAQNLHKNQTRIWMHNMGSHHLLKKLHEATGRRPKRCLIFSTSNDEVHTPRSYRFRDGNNTN